MTGSMIVNLIFTLVMYPVLFIIYFMIKYSCTGNGKYFFGVTKTKEWNDYDRNALEEIEQKFKNSLKRYLLIMAILPLITFFIPYFSISFAVWMIWLLACTFVIFVPIAKAHDETLAWKEQERKKTSNEADSYQKEVTLTELLGAQETRKIKPVEFLIPSAISLVAIVAGLMMIDIRSQWETLLSGATIAAITPLIYVFAVYFDRQKTVVISKDSNQNLNYARAKKQIWKSLWIAFAWINTVFTWIFTIGLLTYQKNPHFIALIIWGSIIYGVILIAVAILTFIKMQKVENIYAKVSEELSDTDQYWKWGIIYNNPHDTHVMIEQRIGMGSTINIATKLGKATMAFAIIALLSIPIMCVWLIFEEFTPIHLTLENQTLQAIHLNVDYTIPLESVEKVELLDELPEFNRIAGSQMDNLEKGKFEIYSEGTCRLFLNPTNEKFLKITTEDDTFYFSGYDDEETLQIYQMIKLD